MYNYNTVNEENPMFEEEKDYFFYSEEEINSLIIKYTKF